MSKVDFAKAASQIIHPDVAKSLANLAADIAFSHTFIGHGGIGGGGIGGGLRPAGAGSVEGFGNENSLFASLGYEYSMSGVGCGRGAAGSVGATAE